MNQEEPLRDQAERLRKRIVKKEENSPQLSDSTLPPRRKVHQQKKKKTKWKLKYPIIRILALFFILLPIVSFSLYTINENNKIGSKEPVTKIQGNFETVSVEKDKEETEIEPQGEIDETGTTVGEINTEEVHSVKPPSASGNYVNDKSTNEKAAQDKKKPKDKILYHKVQNDETLFSIAMRYYKSQSGIEIIKQANGIQGNEIKLGQTLKIPIKE